MLKKERMGIFGGTFNPIHLGHVKAAVSVRDRFRMDKILFVPSYTPPHKKNVDMAAPAHRLRMVELAVAGYTDFIPSAVEIAAGGKSYSIQTLAELRESHPESDMFFILGIDAFLEIDTWKDYEKVIGQCAFIVMSRPGYRLQDAASVLDGRWKNRIWDVEDETIPADEDISPPEIYLYKLEALNISSSDIRRRIKAGRTISELVAPPVEDYIQENTLYRE